MARFKHYNQTSMIVINYQDQLQSGTFEHALHYLCFYKKAEKLDLSAFFQSFSQPDFNNRLTGNTNPTSFFIQ
ncbi:transposase [Oceanospirillum sp.]|uniref:transposase n=1 Tax=Oceanospirillum sp. TaxID=2021254 RepID=UPI003A90A2BF